MACSPSLAQGGFDPRVAQGPDNWNSGAWLSSGLLAGILTTCLAMLNWLLGGVERLLVLAGPLCLAAYAIPATERVTRLWFKVLIVVLAMRFAWAITFVLFSLTAAPYVGAAGAPATAQDMNVLLGLAAGAAAMMLGLPLVLDPHRARRAADPRRPGGGSACRGAAVRVAMPNLVDVPENAVREEPLAFGLTAPQLLICGAAVGVGALLHLLPLWLPIKLVLIVVCAGSVMLAAILPIRNEPAYRWLVRAIRFRRQHHTWHAVLESVPRKSEISEEAHPVMPPPLAAASTIRAHDLLGGREDGVDPAGIRLRVPRSRHRWVSAPSDSGSSNLTTTRVRRPTVRTRKARHTSDPRDPARPPRPARRRGHELCRWRRQDHPRRRDRDAHRYPRARPHARGRRATGPRSRPRREPNRQRRRAATGARRRPTCQRPGAIGSGAIRVPSANSPRRPAGRSTSSPCHPIRSSPSGTGRRANPASRRSACSRPMPSSKGAQTAGYHLIVADLGGVFEDGHRQLIDQADLVLGVVRPTIESLPDVFRLASVLRGQGMGRKLAMVANGADDDTEISRIAREVGVPLARAGLAEPVLHERRRPRRTGLVHGARTRAIAGVARAAWPLLGDAAGRVTRRRSVLRAARDVMPAPGGSHERRTSARPRPRPAVGGDAGHRPTDARRAALPEILNPFGRTAEKEAMLRRTIGEILAEPELDLDASPALVAAVEAVVCGLGPLHPVRR